MSTIQRPARPAPAGPMARRGGRRRRGAGFTIVELLVTLMIIGLVAALIVPNLAAYVPTARIEKEAKTFASNIDFMRSEARIQAKRLVLELDLDANRWRRVFPPEMRLTTDQDVKTLEDRHEEWITLQEDVDFAGAGNARDALVRRGMFRLVFDEDGNTGDQTVVFKLKSDASMVWTVHVHGLTGQCEIISNLEGREDLPIEVGEGAF